MATQASKKAVGRRVREQVFPVGASDYTADSGAPPISFRIAPDPGRTIDLASIELVTDLDTNATLALKGNLAAAAAGKAASMVAADWSFKYPQGLSAFIGRVRVSTGNGLILEEVDGVSVLAESRYLFLGADEAQRLARMEGRGVETNANAFIQLGNAVATTVGTGNSASGNNVEVHQYLETRFRFGSLGGFFDQSVWPLATGLAIDIYLNPFQDVTRQLSAGLMSSPALSSTVVPATATAVGPSTFTYVPQLAANANNLQGVLGVIASGNAAGGTRQMVSGPCGGVYTEQGANAVAINAAGGFLTTTTVKNSGLGAAAVNLPVQYDNGSDVYFAPADGRAKLPAGAAVGANFNDAAGAVPAAETTDARAHGLELETAALAGGLLTALTTPASTNDDPSLNGTGFSMQGYDFPQSAFGRAPVYVNRMLRVMACVTTAVAGPPIVPAVYRYDVVRTAQVAFTGGRFVIACTGGTANALPNNAVTPGATGANNLTLPVAMATLLADTDLTITGAPRLTRVRLEYDSRDGAKPNPKASLEVDSWKTEWATLAAGAVNPSVNIISTCSRTEGVIFGIQRVVDRIQTMVTGGLTSIFPTYDNVGVTSLPFALKADDDDEEVPSESVWLLEQAAGARVKQPNLLVAGGSAFDGILTPSVPASAAANKIQQLSCLYFTGFPLDGKDLVRGRARADFRGTVDAASTMAIFIRHVRTFHIDGPNVAVDF